MVYVPEMTAVKPGTGDKAPEVVENEKFISKSLVFLLGVIIFFKIPLDLKDFSSQKLLLYFSDGLVKAYTMVHSRMFSSVSKQRLGR